MAAADTSNVGAELGVFSAVLSYEDVQTAFSAEHTVSVHSQTTTPTSVLVYFDLDWRSPSNMSVAAIYKERSGRIMVVGTDSTHTQSCTTRGEFVCSFMAALRAIPELRDTRIILCADRNASAADTTLLYEYVRRAGLPNVHMYVGTSGGEPGVWIDAKTRTNCWKEACRVFGDGIVYTQLEWVAGDPEAKRNQLYHQLSNLLVVRLDKLPSDCERKAAAMWVDCEQQLPYCIIRQDGMCRALTMCIFLIDGVDGGDQTLV